MDRTPRAISNFDTSVGSVENLLGFDALVLDLLGGPLRNLKERLEKHAVTNPYLQPDRLIVTLDQVRNNHSLTPYYEAMYNQCLVLLVSHFASAVRDVFVEGLETAAATLSTSVLGEDIKVRVHDLLEADTKRETLIAETIADRGEYSWQDMQSISRAYTKYFGKAPDELHVINDVIVAQAVRHVIVHSGARVDKRLLHQIRNASPRDFNPRLALDERVQLTPGELRQAAKSMRSYLDALAAIVDDL